MNKTLSVLAICPANSVPDQSTERKNLDGQMSKSWPALRITHLEHTSEAVSYLHQDQSVEVILLCPPATAVAAAVPILNSLKTTVNTPVILVTDEEPSSEEQQRARQAGFADVLPHAALLTPLLPRLLQQVIRLHQMERQTKNLQHQIDNLESAQSKFIDDLSHRLRNPLNSVALYLELLELGRVEKRGQYLEALNLQTGRLREMIEDIVKLAHLDSQAVREEPGEIDFNNLVRTIGRTQQDAANQNGVTLHYDLADDLPNLHGRYHQIHQAITCLLDNAIKYAPGGAVQLTTRCPADKTSVQCTVRDNGIGISPAEKPHIFEAYYRGSNPLVAKTVGTGLGLILAKRIVENHNGRLVIEAAPDKGTTATIALPCQTNETDAG